MICNDLREWIDLLRSSGELAEVDAEVDPHLEITEIADRTMKAGGPALLFRNVRGSQHPLLINQFGTERRMCLALGVDRLDDVAAKLADVLELTPPQGIADKLRALGKLKSLADSSPKTVSRGPCQDIVLDPPDLDRLPIMTCWPSDGGPFITLPSVITKDPRTGGRNVGMYRLHKYDARTTGLHWQIHKDAAADWREGAGRMEVAIALGTDPITAYSGSAPLPKHVDELMLAGFLRGRPVELVQCKTVDLQVPAQAEIVIEGYCERGELRPEGPFGDHTGYYTPQEPFPVLHVTAMTMRRDAIYPSIVVGPPPAEDVWLGKATERIFLPAIRATLPELVDYDLPFAGAFHNCCIVSIRKAFPGHARKVMHAIWGLGLLSLTKCVIVVDAHVDVHDYAQVTWQVGANVDPGRDVARQLRAARPARPCPGGAVARRQDRHRRDREVAVRGVSTRVARDRADDRRGARPRRRALGRAGHPARRSRARRWVRRRRRGAVCCAGRAGEPARRSHGRRARRHRVPGAPSRARARRRGCPRASHRAPHGGADRRPARRAHARDGRRLDRARDSGARRGRRSATCGRRRAGAAAMVDATCTGARVVRVHCLNDERPPTPRPGLVELRAALVIGAGSPTFELLRRLADRLPVLPLPRYADRRLQPLAAGDIVACLVAACDGAEDNVSYALAGPDTLAVRDMLALVGGLLGKKPSRLAMPFDAPGAASLVRRLVGTDAHVGADRARGPRARHPRRAQRRGAADRPAADVVRARGASSARGGPSAPLIAVSCCSRVPSPASGTPCVLGRRKWRDLSWRLSRHCATAGDRV